MIRSSFWAVRKRVNTHDIYWWWWAARLCCFVSDTKYVDDFICQYCHSGYRDTVQSWTGFELKSYSQITYHVRDVSVMRIRDEVISMKSWICYRNPSHRCEMMRLLLYPRWTSQNRYLISRWHVDISLKEEVAKSSLWRRHPYVLTIRVWMTIPYPQELVIYPY